MIERTGGDGRSSWLHDRFAEMERPGRPELGGISKQARDHALRDVEFARMLAQAKTRYRLEYGVPRHIR